MKVIAIAAVAKNGVIGKGLELPWNIPEDMRFFRNATKGQKVLMGRKTFDALKKPLLHRENIVITRNPHWSAPGVRVFHNVSHAIDVIKKEPKTSDMDLFIMGGAQIYKESFPALDEIWLTEIQADHEGDVFFPDFKAGKLHRPEFEKYESRPQSEQVVQNDLYFFNKYRRKGALPNDKSALKTII